MNAKLAIALVLLFAVLLTGCQGTVPAVTSEPTAVFPTEVPPTAVPSPTQTEVPTATPTEVPMYVGLPASEIEALREQCLQANPDSDCLPLPFAPVPDAQISLLVFPGYPRQTFADGKGESQFLTFEIPAGTDLLSPLAEEVWIQGYAPGLVEPRWLGKPGRSIDGLEGVIFGFGPFASYPPGVLVFLDGSFYDEGTASYYQEAAVALNLVKSDCWSAEADPIPFEEGDLLIPDESRTAVVGELLARAEVPMCLRITAYDAVLLTAVGEGWSWSAIVPVGRTETTDLLTTDAGSIVYVLP